MTDMIEAQAERVPPFADAFSELVQRVRGGEVEAFEPLMVLAERPVLAVAYRLLGDRELAKDAAQEVFLRVYRSLDSFRLGESFLSWVYQITVNVSRDLARKRGGSHLHEEVREDHAHEGRTPAEEALLQAERRALVQDALGQLPPGERSALVLRDLQGLPTEEVARILGVRPVTVRTQIASARHRLRSYFEGLFHASPGGAR